ncbi:RNA polymerase sigma factor [Mucilaginibacter sp. UR6-11]|uniref:RNA polymerase sigma factor n=1 Tax=Mucilaginibacter sp. UR6-11 TaxID=1435644 RepID=UPI001E65CA89|nr:RNA polymerase sigma-70 factor [Mucilaginibacter sp. UR6-11]MCC8424584.1 RNA polymerase sigma-70 factor [Mucilaginibacter sp. UR6-11]
MKILPVDTLNELFENWKIGDENSFEKLFNQLFPALLKFANKTLRDAGQAEELVMDIFYKIWSKKNELCIQGDIDKYLYKCVKHGIIDHYRKKIPSFQPLDELETPLDFQPACDEKLINTELEHHYSYAISRLSPKRQEVYKLSRMDGMSYKEIASYTGLSINTVENHMSAALRFLKTYLKEADIILAIFLSLHIFFQ